MMSKWIVRTIAGLSIVLEVYLLYHMPTVLLALMFLLGRSECSFKDTLDAARWKAQYVEAKENMKKFSRLVRQDDDLELWATPRGEFWMPKGDIASQLGVLAEQEMKVYGDGPLGIRPGDVVIDCGADIGTFSRPAIERGAILVIAVEPARENRSCLQRNLEREIAAGKLKIYPKGVWNKDELLPMYNPGIYGSVVMKLSSPTGMVQLTTIDKIVAELKLERVDFIKMDIEGAEKQALQGARQTLIRFKPRLAISAEHSVADAIPRTVREVAPSYTAVCGPCAYLDGHICPHVIYLH